MSATDAVLQNATYHAQLLAGIAELDYVPPALEQQDKYIVGLEQEAAALARKIKALEWKTSKERKEHEDLRDSTTRRFAAKIIGRKEKFEAKASKEEQEYVEALEKEMQHKRQQATLATMIAEAKAVRVDLQSKLERYNLTKQDLAQLYNKIFDGPTQAYPEDDQLEYQLQQAQGRYNEIQGFLNRESQALNLLQSANSALLGCNSKMQEALSYSQWDMWGGGTMSDMMERNALSSAEGLSLQAETFVQQAMLTSPNVKPIGQVSIAHGSILSDVIFDNIFTDMAFHDKIKASARNVEAVQFNLTNELNAARGRSGAIGADLNAASEALRRARGALDAFRRSIFDSLSGGGSGSELPAYTPPAGPPPGHPAAQVTMPRGPDESGNSNAPPPPPPMPQGPDSGSSSYAPPPGPPPPQVQSPGQSSQGRPAGLPANPRPSGLPANPKPSGSYAPPLEPPPAGESRATSPSAWGSRNPYAAALATGGTTVAVGEKPTTPTPTNYGQKLRPYLDLS